MGAKLFKTKDELERYQLERINWTISQARNASFYKGKLEGIRLGSVHEIEKLPFVTKDDLREQSPHGMITVSRNELSHYIETFGTTGKPTSSWLTSEDFRNYARQINEAGVNFRPGDIVLIRFPYAFSSPAHIVQQAAKDRGACVVTAGSRTFVSPHSRVIECMHKLNVSVFCGLPFEAILLAETARLMGLEPGRDFPEMRAICVAGELLTDLRKKWIENIWKVKVYDLYGSTETGNMAATCSHGQLHVSLEHFYFEIIDRDTYEVLPYGERGTLVVTTLTREAMPLIRYIIEDIAELHPGESCPCGSHAPILKLFGRKQDVITFKHSSITLTELEDLVLTLPWDIISNIWMIVIEEEQIRIKIETNNMKARIPEEWFQEAYSKAGVPVKVSLHEIGTLFDRKKLLDVRPVIKPRYVYDARNKPHSEESLDTLLAGYHTF